MDRNFCLTILNKIFIDEEYELIEWKLERFEEHVGYHGTHGRLYITASHSNKTTTLRFFVKIATENNEIFDRYWKQVRCFEKEYHMLGRIVGELEDAIGEKLAPKCYMNELNKVVVQEDLAELGYNSEKEKSKNFNFVWKTIEKMAVFHSASIIIEHKFGKKVKDIFPEINYENMFKKPHEEGYVMHAVNRIISNLVKRKFRDIPTQFNDRFINWFLKTLEDAVKPSTKYRNVICHGDPWFMNFMYKTNENGDFQDVLMVDFQFSRIAPPALEIQHYLSLLFSLDTIRSMKEKVIDTYYNKMSETLSQAGIEIYQILPKEDFTESFNVYQPFGLAANAFYQSIVSIPSKYSKKMTPNDFIKLMTVGNLEITEEAFDNDEKYHQTMYNAVMACYNFFLGTH